MTEVSEAMGEQRLLRRDGSNRGKTASGKKFRYQSFQQRIAQIQIDPARKRRAGADDTAAEEDSHSYTVAALQRWQEINTSANFRACTREIASVCHTLAQVVHGRAKIVETILRYIQLHDVHSLEALLDLLINVARDLQTGFEPFFAATMTTLADLALRVTEVEAIEWAFYCFAWLFKYLQRVLVPDLRPLIKIMTGLLGKTTHKPHLVRFAAEALSFLIRRAAISRRPESLNHALDALLAELDTAESRPLYRDGLLTVILSAMKGVQRGLSSGALAIFDAIYRRASENHVRDALEKLVIGIIHSCNAQGLMPLLTLVLSRVEDSEEIELNSRLLFLFVTVRKGTRIADWQRICRSAASVDLITVILQYAPAEVLDVDLMTRVEFGEQFLAASSVILDLAPARFDFFVMPALRIFLKKAALDLRLPCLRLIQQLSKVRLPCPSEWQNVALEDLTKLDQLEEECSLFLRCIPSFDLPSKFLEKYLQILTGKIAGSDGGGSSFMMGPGLRFWSQANLDADIFSSWWPSMEHNIESLRQNEDFLHALKTLLRPDMLSSQLLAALDINLRSGSSSLRLVSLELLNMLKPGDAYETAIRIDSTAMDLENARAISMHFRRLATLISGVRLDPQCQSAMINFAFGILRHDSQIREEAIGVLKAACEHTEGEEKVMTIALRWLHGQEEFDIVLKPRATSDDFVPTDFSCSNLYAFEKHCRNSAKSLLNPDRNNIEKTSDFSKQRFLAIKLFSQIPQIAEKRSRQIVPVFLEPTEDDYSTKQALLGLFGQFQNPVTLFRSSDVYAALLRLLENGDLKIQTAALTAILTWKEQPLQAARESLFNLLDEARLREEIAALSSLDRSNIMPVLLRILYGRAIARSGGSRNHGGQIVNRRLILECIYQFEDADFDAFVDIAVPDDLGLVDSRHQLGIVNMLHSMATVFGRRLDRLASRLLTILIYCLQAAGQPDGQISLQKDIRQTSIQCLTTLSQNIDSIHIQPIIPTLFQHILEERLEKMAVESAQSVSSILRLFAVWASQSDTLSFLHYDPRLLPAVSACLTVPFAKNEVRLFVMQEILHFVVLSPDCPSDDLVSKLCQLMEMESTPEVHAVAITLLAHLGPRIVSQSAILYLLRTARDLLSKRAFNHSKEDLLQLSLNLIPRAQGFDGLELWSAIASLYGTTRDREMRTLVGQTLGVLTLHLPEFSESVLICELLNTWSGTRVEEPDFEIRLDAFSRLGKERDRASNWWLPIVHNLLFFVRDEEMAIRSHAALSLRSFIQQNSHDLVEKIILPNIQRGMAEPSELVRSELLSVMAAVVKYTKLLQDMKELLMGDDEEASFFNNVLHIQQHRRQRAVRRLAEASEQLHSGTVAHFLFPLLEHFIYHGEDANLSADTVTTMVALSSSLEWPQFRAILHRYITYVQARPDYLKATLKLVIGFSKSLSSAMQRSRPSRLAETTNSQAKVTETINHQFLAPMKAFLHDKDETTVSLRVPVATSICLLLVSLPEGQLEAQLPAMLTDVCNILRSRAPESRDLARRTLTDIAQIVGAQYFGFILQELRGALVRGYQLHVLSYTVHSILVGCTFPAGTLDYCLERIMTVVIDDIFGMVGQEKEADDYINKMKEVKSSKSFDSMELLAQCTSLQSLPLLLQPVQTVLQGRTDLRISHKVDELLRRLVIGLLRNECAIDHKILVFCHEMMRTTHDNPKLLRTALDLLRGVLSKTDDLRTPQNVHGFVPAIGDAILQKNEEVQTAALRLLAAIIRVPLRSINDNCPLYIAECVKIAREDAGSAGELLPAALKVVTVILRDKPQVAVRETDLAFLLKRMQSNLQQHEHQGLHFGLLKSILSRKFLLPEAYQIMDLVQTMMVTDQSRNARELARGAYFQFLMDYPLTQTHFKKHVAFLTKNLEYRHTEGRQSVMEAILLLFNKVDNPTRQTFFVPLVLTMVNDESDECRAMAGQLLKTLLERAEDSKCDEILLQWLMQDEQPLLLRASLQMYDLAADRICDSVWPRIDEILSRKDADWELLYHTLKLQLSCSAQRPQLAFAASAESAWEGTARCLSYPHLWIKTIAASTMNAYFVHFARSGAKQLPLRGSQGLALTEDAVLQHVRVILGNLTSPENTKQLAESQVRNLAFLVAILLQNPTVRVPGEKIPALQYVIIRCCNILRQPASSSNLLAMTSALQLLTLIMKQMDEAGIASVLQPVLVPLQHLADATVSAPFSTDADFLASYKDLVSGSQNLMSDVQAKVGAERYLRALYEVKSQVRERREGRRTKRAIQRVVDVEGAAMEKRRKFEKKREKRKERSGQYREQRRV